jgi:hypothetical protein
MVNPRTVRTMALMLMVSGALGRWRSLRLTR